MQLANYLREQGESAAAFGRRAEISEASMSRILRGAQVPRADIMARIVAATSGAVRPNDFYPSPTPPKRKRPANGAEAVR